MAGLKTILEAADLIAAVRNAFSKIESLEGSMKRMLEVIESQDRRLRELEAGLREARSDIRLDAVKETQAIVNSVQGNLYEEIRALAVKVDRIERPRLVDANDAMAGKSSGHDQPKIGDT